MQNPSSISDLIILDLNLIIYHSFPYISSIHNIVKNY
jgi:hypothetical protein